MDVADYFGTIADIIFHPDYILVKVLSGRPKDNSRWYVRIAPTNLAIRVGDALDYTNGVLYWTTAQAEVASRRCDKFSPTRVGREKFEDVRIEMRCDPWS